ncbi:MAG TPA: hypothetical protein VNO23_07560 [Candidatus Binatia bacterium]|nr:hypothetical protein [Candidatus Binatia bacterium]
MTPLELYAAVDARRRQLGLLWWEVEVQADISNTQRERLRAGRPSAVTRRRVEEWLRRQAPPGGSD